MTTFSKKSIAALRSCEGDTISFGTLKTEDLLSALVSYAYSIIEMAPEAEPMLESILEEAEQMLDAFEEGEDPEGSAEMVDDLCDEISDVFSDAGLDLYVTTAEGDGAHLIVASYDLEDDEG